MSENLEHFNYMSAAVAAEIGETYGEEAREAAIDLFAYLAAQGPSTWQTHGLGGKALYRCEVTSQLCDVAGALVSQGQIAMLIGGLIGYTAILNTAENKTADASGVQAREDTLWHAIQRALTPPKADGTLTP